MSQDPVDDVLILNARDNSDRSTAATTNLYTQVSVVAGIAVLMTIGVYGLVAAIVKLDDAGIYLVGLKGEGAWRDLQHWFGLRILDFAPWLMKALAVIGTAAMFMVGGGILVHGLHPVEVIIGDFTVVAATVPAIGPVLSALAPTLLGAFFGIVAGAVVLLLVVSITKLRGLLS